jgi:CBS domain-containing protein
MEEPVKGVVECSVLETTRAYQVMSSPPVTVTPGDTIEGAAKVMYEARVGSVVVVDADGKLAGILTRRDLIYLLASGIARKNPPVRLYMTESVITARENESISQILEKMKEAGVRHIVVIDADNRPIGVVSMWDILMLIARRCLPGF